MRDPVMYRILHASHHRTGDKWCIYPMYDFAHGQSDSLEQITHSVCTLEFEDHRPLYNWFIQQLGIFPSQQIEFDRLNLTYTLLSKRKLLQLVQEGHVRGWDDPRMPTLSGHSPPRLHAGGDSQLLWRNRRIEDQRHYRSRHAGALCSRRPEQACAAGDGRAPSAEGRDRQLSREPDRGTGSGHNPEDASAGMRKLPFSSVLYIEQDDFREEPPKKFFRLSPGQEVRLRGGYFITCRSVVKDDAGEVVEVHCTYDPETRSGNAPDNRKVKATIHWVSAQHAVSAEVRVYENLFLKENPGDVPEGQDFTANLNPNSLEIITDAKLEPSLANAKPGDRYQFERMGYFCADLDSKPGTLVFNRTVPLRDSWAKIEKREKSGRTPDPQPRPCLYGLSSRGAKRVERSAVSWVEAAANEPQIPRLRGYARSARDDNFIAFFFS